MPKWPSVKQFVADSKQAFKRFPLVFAASFISFVFSLVLVELKSDSFGEVLAPYFASCILAISVYFSLTLLSEATLQKDRKTTIALFVAALASLCLFSLTYKNQDHIFIHRFFQLLLATHLLASFAGYFFNDNLNDFWQFNRLVFIRISIALFYSTVLYVGLAFAMLAIDRFLGIKIRGEMFIRLWATLAFVYNTWFFLIDIPKTQNHPEPSTDYPKEIKIFGLYVLMPLAVIYVLILYTYMGQIFLKRTWPEGTIGWLVCGYAAIGILSHLLLYPLQNRDDQKSVQFFCRGFYYLLFPLVILLFLAINRRVSEYGITEKRYFLYVLTGWFGFLSVYFGILKKKNIKLIPMSLAFLSFITIAGPWGAYSVSHKNQLNRLEKILEKIGSLKEGKVQRASSTDFKDRKNISGILDYLFKTDRISSLEPLFGDVVNDEKIDTQKLMDKLGLKYVQRWQAQRDNEWFSYNAKTQNDAVRIEGYTHMTSFHKSQYSGTGGWQKIDRYEYQPLFEMEKSILKLEFKNGPSISFSIDSLIENVRSYLKKEGIENPNLNIPKEVMTLVQENEFVKVKVIVTSLYGGFENEKRKIQTIQGKLLFRFK